MSTNNFFEHQVIPQNAPTSPVESLAAEVAGAFDKVSDLLGTDTVYPSLNKVLGNFVLTDLAYHGFSQVRSDTFSISSHTKDLALSYIPTSAIALSYLDSTSNTEVFLTQKQPTQELTSRTDFKVLGRVIVLAGSFVGLTLKASYTGIEPALAGRTVKPNVLKNANGTYLRPLVEDTPTTYSLTYDVDVQSLFSKFFNTAVSKETVYLIAKENGTYTHLTYDSVTLAANKLTFVIDAGLDKDYSEVLVYILNVTVADLLESLYKEFVTHKHSKDGTSKPIDHKDILNNYQNTSRIFYKDSETPNYNHPQALNREGYNATVTSAYENSMLGDLFLAALISENDQTFKSLSKNSVRLLFGDPVAGSKIYYDQGLRSLNLLSGAGLNGLNITTGNGLKALSINNDTYLLEVSTHTELRGKNNKIIITDNGTSDAHLETKHFKATGGSTLNEVTATQIKIGNTVTRTDGSDVFVEKFDNANDSTIYFNSDTVFKQIHIEDGSVDHLVLQGRISTNPDNFLENRDNNFTFNLKDKEVQIVQNSGRFGGSSLGSATKRMRTYSSDFLGQLGTSVDTSFYTETPKDSEHFLLKSTEEPLVINGVTYVFQQDVAGAVRIDSLKDWKRATFNAGAVTAYKLTLDVSDQYTRNGLKIGETRISVIGPLLDCPEGATIFESRDTVHFVKPLGEGDVECNSVNYQNVNLGYLQVLGDAAFAENATIVGNLSVGDTATVDTLSVSTVADLREVNIAGTATFSGNSVFIGAVSIANNLDISGAADITGSLGASDGTFKKFVSIGETLTVGGQAIFDDNLVVQGSIHTARDFSTAGSITAGSLKAGDSTLGSVVAQGSITVSGSITTEGPATFKSNIGTSGNLSVGGNADVTGEITADSLYVTSDTTLIGRFVVDGPTTITSSSVIIGSQDASILLTGNLQVSGTRAVFSGDVNVQGEFVASSAVRLNDTLTVAGETETVTLKVGATATIGGNLKADSAEFTRKVYFQDGLKTSGSSDFTEFKAESGAITDLSTDELYIRNVLSMGPDARVTAYYLEVSEFQQKDPAGTATFAGEAYFNNTTFFNDKIIVGNADIEHKRATSGCLITDNQIKLGNNSTVEAVKFYAAKGTPVGGNRDQNAGYCFASSYVDSGVDGDTGLFAVTNTDSDGQLSHSGLDGSDLEIWIDGARKYVFYKQEIAFDEPMVDRYGLAVVTLNMLQRAMANMDSKITAAATSMNAATWPVGSIYITTNDADPYSLFKFGHWVRFAPGRTLVGRVLGDIQVQGGQMDQQMDIPANVNLSSVRSTFGQFQVALNENHIPEHNHHVKSTSGHSGHDQARTSQTAVLASYVRAASSDRNFWIEPENNTTLTMRTSILTTFGKGQAHTNVQPSIVVNMWERQS